MRMTLAMVMSTANATLVYYYGGPMWACAATAVLTYSILIGPIREPK
jgi:hypothetical protein